MTYEELQYLTRYIPGTIVGLHPYQRFETRAEAENVTRSWDDTGDWSIEPIRECLGNPFWVIALKDCEDGEIVAIL